MNKILQDLINTGEVASFINSVIIEMEKKKYNKIIKEVVKMLAENNLHVKPEKCKWKVRKVEFFNYRVVIGPERINMEKEKIKAVL